MDYTGAPIVGEKDTKVLRSGFRNMQMGAMASITTLSDPRNDIVTNIYENVLQASAIEYTNTWPTACDCFPGAGNTNTENVATTNPFLNGTHGYWKPSTSYLHLTGRQQTDYNNNTNLRRDGVFTSYNPFYKRAVNGKWEKDYANWTYTSQVTIFSPYGPELENRDALGRHSAAIFGYEQTLPIGVAANAKYSEIGFENFENSSQVTAAPGTNAVNCADSKFRLYSQTAVDGSNTAELTDAFAHTGRYSLRVIGQKGVSYNEPIVCEPDACVFALAVTLGEFPQNAYSGQLSILGGLAPYSIDWQILSGAPSFNITGGGTALDVVATSTWTAMLIITDANGNVVNQLIEP
ncbi:MAG: hypothetical protein ACKVOK_12595 [Flavobacteriales bacterium]